MKKEPSKIFYWIMRIIGYELVCTNHCPYSNGTSYYRDCVAPDCFAWRKRKKK